jgi:hypothetical protein
MIERLVLPPWLRLGLILPLLVLNLWVLRQLLLPLAPFPALFIGAALIAFLLDIPTRWLHGRGLPRGPVPEPPEAWMRLFHSFSLKSERGYTRPWKTSMMNGCFSMPR